MTTIATTTIVYHIQPFFVVLIGVIFLGERASLAQMLWIIGAFVGVILASGAVGSSSTVNARWFLGLALRCSQRCSTPSRQSWRSSSADNGRK